MAHQALAEHAEQYVDLEGTEYPLTGLDATFREDLAALIQYYNWNPPFPQFKTYWRSDESPVGLYLDSSHPHHRLVKAIGRDLERRLGLSQGRIAS